VERPEIRHLHEGPAGRQVAAGRRQLGQLQTVIITEAQKTLVGQMTPQLAADSMAKQIDAILAKK
jgi:ABC-type glycerol-3-phosphate transport system substrate-binding protein